VLDLSPVKILIIVVIGLIVLGPDKLPQFAKQAGAAWKTLRSLQERVESELRETVPDLPRSADIARYARSPISLLNQLADRATAEEADAAAAAPQAAAPEPPSTGEPQAPEEPQAADGSGYRPPDDAPPVRDPERPPLAWGDPSLN
jgi:sec-independent protein translocase protein TatB